MAYLLVFPFIINYLKFIYNFLIKFGWNWYTTWHTNLLPRILLNLINLLFERWLKFSKCQFSIFFLQVERIWRSEKKIFLKLNHSYGVGESRLYKLGTLRVLIFLPFIILQFFFCSYLLWNPFMGTMFSSLTDTKA